MSRPADVLALVHGMTSSGEPTTPQPRYDAFWSRLVNVEPDLAEAIDGRVGVSWGHQPPVPGDDSDGPGGVIELRPDQLLTAAERFVGERVSYANVRRDDSAANHPLTGVFERDYGIPFVRGFARSLRESIVLRGFGDAVYYCSRKGERYVRRAVYDQILGALEPQRDADAVRLHLFGHSLGATVCHDFLFGLFCGDDGYRPDFVQKRQGLKRERERYEFWRRRAQEGTLALGSLATAASQLPLFVLRSQDLVERLAHRRLLDPDVIGLVADGRPQWRNFYDVDDLLGFPVRRLYEERAEIEEIQVDIGDLPVGTHGGYWRDDLVVAETAELVLSRAG